MSPPLLGRDEGLISSSTSTIHNGSGVLERNYLLLSDSSSVDSSSLPDENKIDLNLRATELRLGLPGSQSPEREYENCFPRLPLLQTKDGRIVSGNKRGFADTVHSEFVEKNWMFQLSGSDSDSPKSMGQSKLPVVNTSATQATIMKDMPSRVLDELSTNGFKVNQPAASDTNGAPAAKAQVVGWPPIRSYRKNTLATTTSKNNDEVDGKPGAGAVFVKVSMDGAPYLRKADLRNYSAYQELSSALEKMFRCFTLGQCGSHGAPGKEMLSESKLRDLLHGSEYVLTYEDKDGDWMLVGDVPWEMFIETCRRLKIMKSSDAIGLAPRSRN